MKLGRYVWDKPVFLAPMAGVTDKAFRETVRSVGGRLVWTEMISDKALTYRNSRTLSMLNLAGEEEPRIVQLFGSDPDTMARAAVMAEESGATVIDINMGCPTPKITKNGEGAALLLNVHLAAKIASAVVKAVNVPVSVKLRLGWNHQSMVVPDLAKYLEEAGVQMLTLHARTREQFYSGQADWEWIRKLKRSVQIPLIGNGDVTRPEDAQRMLDQTGCDGVMIGRATLGNPWLIPRAQTYIRSGEIFPEPTLQEKMKVAGAHFERLIRYKGEHIGLNEMRKHAVWYIKGIRNAASLRDEIMQLKSVEEMKAVLGRIVEQEA